MSSTFVPTSKEEMDKLLKEKKKKDEEIVIDNATSFETEDEPSAKPKILKVEQNIPKVPQNI